MAFWVNSNESSQRLEGWILIGTRNLKLIELLSYLKEFLLDGYKGAIYIETSNEMIEGRRKHEENISAIKYKESQRPWFPETNVHQGGEKDSKKTQSQKKKQAHS